METNPNDAAVDDDETAAILTGPLRAGRVVLAPLRQSRVGPPPGLLMGRVDAVHPHRIVGWALDVDAPDRPVVLRVLADGLAFARVVANLYRSDLKAAGFASGWHGFELAVRRGVLSNVPTTIEVQREADKLNLPDSPWTLSARDVAASRTPDQERRARRQRAAK